MAVKKKNIFLKNTIEPFPYAGQGRPGSNAPIPHRSDPVRHANILKRKLIEAYEENKNLTPDQVAAIRYKDGVYLEFSGQENHDLVVKSLENVGTGIRLLNVRSGTEEEDLIKATVYVPEGKESYFINRFEKYLTAAHECGKLPYKDLINSIESIRLAMLDSFWVGRPESIPTDTSAWCEVWLRVDNNSYEPVEEAFENTCLLLEIKFDERSIRFPERMVKLVCANAAQLGQLIKINGDIAEMRRSEAPVSFFEELSSLEQKEWTEELLSRIENDPTDTSICILDTGLNSGHPLIEPFCEEECIQSVDGTWGENDHQGHGTEMAGIALFFDLKEKLMSEAAVSMNHSVESVKILPPIGQNDPKLYGAITQDAVYLAETVRPGNSRAICMAVTEKNEYNINDGRPSSWSGAIDSLVSGVGDDTKRLFFISAGNVQPMDLASGYPDVNLTTSVQSPGQAWNAITVGAYSNGIQIDDKEYSEYSPVADCGELSPYSPSSLMWDKKWPIKPEILCDGGNVASDGLFYTECADLSLLTTYYRPFVRLFSTIWGTSSATAQAAWIAAQIMAEYPDIWPETVRALLIHSARWTEKMKSQFCEDDKKTRGKRMLLRTCGYGIPSLDRAIECLNNRVNMIIEAELQPFTKEKKMNEMHLHKIPWPKSVLEDLANTPVEMRVTLSYFIEPGPGEIGWKDKYRYPSCGLRFDVINTDERKEDFLKRVNIKMRGEDKSDIGEGSSGSEHWYLGPNNRDVGSIHSDFRLQSAIELCNANYIAVYPVVGWWRERSYLKCYDRKVRYSLIVSISAPESNIDLYTPIISQIEVTAQTVVEIDT